MIEPETTACPCCAGALHRIGEPRPPVLPRGLPLIVLPHGGPFARDSWDFDPWVQFLANRGYAVLQVNFRGSTGYGRAWVERDWRWEGLAARLGRLLRE